MTLAATALILGLTPATATGPITDEQKEALGFSLVYPESVMKRVFNLYELTERKRIQTSLQELGLYEALLQNSRLKRDCPFPL